MSTHVLGLLEHVEEHKEYVFSNIQAIHMDKREKRRRLVYSKAEPAFYFEVYREKDKSRQVHCLLNDATIIVFNKSNKKIITLLIADEKLIDKYVKHSFCSKSELDKIYKCAQLNRRTKAHKDCFANFDYQMYHSKKEKILMWLIFMLVFVMD